jgi:hypothetical protein
MENVSPELRPQARGAHALLHTDYLPVPEAGCRALPPEAKDLMGWTTFWVCVAMPASGSRSPAADDLKTGPGGIERCGPLTQGAAPLATCNLRKFSEPDRLKTIKPARLIAFLRPYDDYLSRRGFELPDRSDDEIDYESLAKVLIHPDDSVPRQMVDALYFVHEMAADEQMDELLEAAKQHRLPLHGDQDNSPADVAIQIWLTAPDLLQEKHAEARAIRQKNFAYFAGRHGRPRPFPETEPKLLRSLERSLDGWFKEHRRGEGSRVFVFDHSRKVWILIRHGTPFKREGSVKEGKSSVEYYRPEVHDVLIYDTEMDDIGVHAGTKGERDLYLRQIGEHLFGDPDYFPQADKFTLAPLIENGRAALHCDDVPGLEGVWLVEFDRYWGGDFKAIEIRKATDIFGAIDNRHHLLAGGRMSTAIFKLKFPGSKRLRSATIRPPNIAKYDRHSDSELIETWLQLRGFIKPLAQGAG